ncbi:hypothetical protein EZ449_14830 [Pedobacter frigidisoli]|uniref:Lipoprotein n=1 Tax=Pedobacter frigidisoli TaxID=2530455 RepID=A0A4R0NZ52_9SPHI|nr:hypothetical protein [Pedobacter frigidisoli]TCD07063.1 hypothetical protein EZ449_14830 [Pedobacter frigidisoli]
MKNTITFLGLAAVFFASCQGGTAKKTQAKIDSTIVTNSENQVDAKECFQFIKNRDTASLSINKTDNTVKGNLSYNFYEKDKNAGTISGLVKGDTIIADYTFQSEGTKSVREVVWLKQGNQLIEGFGDVQEVDGKTKFKDISKLKFGASMVFSKTPCK